VKKVLLLALAVLAAALVIPAAFAGNGPANKATADLWFNNGGLSAHWVFDAHDLGATGDKGSVFYQDANGSYTANVVNADVQSATTATFSATVTSSTYPGISVGNTFTWTVYDNGEPGIGVDYFTFAGTGDLQYPITAGNIQVHYNA
jgi:hypothetical protein